MTLRSPMPTSGLMPAEGPRASSAHLRALHPLGWKKKRLRETKITYLKNAHKNPAVSQWPCFAHSSVPDFPGTHGKFAQGVFN